MSFHNPVITGVGVISPIGCDRESFLGSLFGARDGIEPITQFDTEKFRSKYYGKITCTPDPGTPEPDGYATWDRQVQLAFCAARQAVHHAAIDCRKTGRRMGLICATCSGAMLTIEKYYAIRYGKQDGSIDNELLRRKTYYSSAGILAECFGIQGFRTTVVTACAAGSNAIGLASDLIRMNRLDVVLVTGSDAFAPSTYAGFDMLKATAPEKCAPFSSPPGLTLGEGAGAFVIESQQHATENNKVILGWIRGYGLSNDAFHPTAPHPKGDGAVLAMTRALNQAGVLTTKIDYINAHGTGTSANDRIESKAIQRVFGMKGTPPISSTKSFFGHTLGAAGILEAAAALLCAREKVIPPTLRFTGPRVGCRLDYVPNQPRRADVDCFMSNSFAFGGNDCALIISRSKNPADDTRTKPSVVITGCGVISPLGLLPGDFINGIPVIPQDTQDSNSVLPQFSGRCGEIRGTVDRRLPLRDMDTASRMATMATKYALQQARYPIKPESCREMGLIMGLTHGPRTGESAHLKSIFTNGLHVPNLVHFPFIVLNSICGNVSRALMLKGFSSTLCNGPGAGTDALIYGIMAVQLGYCDSVAAGSVDELHPGLAEEIRQLNQNRPAPVTPSEAAVTLILENRDAALQRQAPILAELMDWSVFSPAGEHAANQFETEIRKILDRNALIRDDITVLFGGDSALDNSEIIENIRKNVWGKERPYIRSSQYIGTAYAASLLLDLCVIAESNYSGYALGLFHSAEGNSYILLIRNPPDNN